MNTDFKKFFLTGMMVFLPACVPGGGFLGGGLKPCSLYNYNEKQKLWTNHSGQVVQCTLSDGKNILDYIPGEGCRFWQKRFSGFKEVKISEVVIQKQGAFTPQKFCVLNRYMEEDHSGKVLILGDSYCLKEGSERGQYTYASCDGVYKKNKKT